jgi:predicted AAA+ superfamily ATPase
MISRTASSLLRKIIETYSKMAFLSGPRQVGKTTLARAYQDQFTQSVYFNWDVVTDQKRLLDNPYFFEGENRDPAQPFLVVLDEIHKYARWKNYLKGAYDRYHKEFRFLVTGSGRLDLFKKGGDSLLGRYFKLPLFPLSVGEILGASPTFAAFQQCLVDLPAAPARSREGYETLYHYSGFPEPFLRGSEEFYRLWSSERKSRLVREDIRNASAIRELSQMEMLSHLIPERVGSPLSLNSLREDIGVAFETVRDWVLLLDQFYYLFQIRPYSKTLARALTKGPKVYLYDWVEIETPGYRFENLVALHLLKAVKTWKASGDKDVALHYLRDKEKRETDFALVLGGHPICLVEAKATGEALDSSLLYFQEKLSVPVTVQIVHTPGICRKMTEGRFTRWVVSADRWLANLP